MATIRKDITGYGVFEDVQVVTVVGDSGLSGGSNLLPVDTLSSVTMARQLTAGATSVNTPLTSTVRRISFYARNADIRYEIGAVAQTATATSHFIGMGERIDLDVPANANIAVIRAGTTYGVLELSELV